MSVSSIITLKQGNLHGWLVDNRQWLMVITVRRDNFASTKRLNMGAKQEIVQVPL